MDDCEQFNMEAKPSTGGDFLTGRYVDKPEALEVLAAMKIRWTLRQLDWTSEPDHTGARRWPWFLDDKGILRIDEGFIHRQFKGKQLAALEAWQASMDRG